MPNLSDYAPQSRGQMLSYEDLLLMAMSAPQYVRPALNPDAGFVDLGQYAPDPIGSFTGGFTKGLIKGKKPAPSHWRSGAIEPAWQDYRAGERGDYGGFGGGGGYSGGYGDMGLGDYSSFASGASGGGIF